ncbi:ATP-binding protein [Leptospira sp. severe_002]|uniref:ATP-binding protein n=1 Tax=Leptospira sp. severe_002 TaxID=2838237 RepID=UPI001E629EA3|nr:ATP-binding protein [Leptospira sp. severe_002]
MPKLVHGKSRKVARKTARPRRKPVRGAQAVGAALADLAHDIRTPLTGIVAMAELLHASDLPEREQRWAQAIRDSANHLAQLTTLVVDTARAEAKGLVLRHEPFALKSLVTSIADSLAARASGKSLKPSIAIAPDLPERAIGDAVRLRSALENLIDNAVKFTERGTVALKVGVSKASRGAVRLTFTVTDSGIGIVASDLKKLFRPFSQANADVSRRYGGAGLGLVFVKRIAGAMGGTLDVKSAPGRGSTFTLAVPVQLDATVLRKGGKGRLKNPEPVGLRVLCVEDNPYGRVVLNAVLTELGHRVTFAGTGEQAVDLVKQGGYDAVLMDLVLPGIDGLEATRRIRALPPPEGRIPIVGLSGKTDSNDADAAAAAGMNGYLRKPASPAELHEMLGGFAKRKG